MSGRLPTGGTLIDRERPLGFSFDGAELAGLAGDTVAAALLANGVDVVGRSIYRGRPRGIYAAGVEDPNAYFRIGSEPMACGSDFELADGLVVESLTGRGRIGDRPGDVRHDHAWRHCDTLIVGAGPAGLAAAAAAVGTGDVSLIDAGPFVGGSLLDDPDDLVDGLRALEWAGRTCAEIESAGATVLARTQALGLFDNGLLVAVQKDPTRRTERLLHIRARRIVVACGSLERPIAFAGNDRPGVMLASGARAFVRRWAVAPGRRAAVFTTNDGAYDAAVVLADAGVEVAAIVDTRSAPGDAARSAAESRSIPILTEHATVSTLGGDRLEEIVVAPIGGGSERRFELDLLAVSGGWNPRAELPGHLGPTLSYDRSCGGFVPPAGERDGLVCVGAATGATSLGRCLEEGWAAGGAAGSGKPVPAAVSAPQGPAGSFWGTLDDDETAFVDLHRDVTVADLRRAVDAGLRSPEHVKRYTTLGTGPDQGRAANVLALGILAEMLGEPLDSLAPPSSRPPVVGVSFGLLAGRASARLSDPARLTPIHAAHVTAGAVFEEVGQWKRPWYYPLGDEGLEAATRRECEAVRKGVGMMDASTLGKIDVHGPDAIEFMERMYTGGFAELAVEMAKYAILCRSDGMVFDDGIAMRVAEDRFLVTTTTGNAAAVYEWFEEWLQTEWPELRVHCTSVTEQLATVVVAGPSSRRVLEALAPELALDVDSFPAFALREAEVAGVRALVCRVSFSGELAYEIHVPGWHGLTVWNAVAEAGEEFAITPYGTEALHVLRAEKGYFIVGQETDGTVTPGDLGYGWAIAKKKPDFVGRRSLLRPDLQRSDRLQLVALLCLDPAIRLTEGARVRGAGGTNDGHVTSSYFSTELQRPFALGMVRAGRDRLGAKVEVSHDGGWVEAEVHGPVLVDPEGARRDG